MFYSHVLLSRRFGGRFSLIWCAATDKKRLSTVDVMKVNIEETCIALMSVIQEESADASQRFSLYLSSMLIHGTCIIYHRQLSLFYDELMHWKMVLHEGLIKKMMITAGERPQRPDMTLEAAEGEEGRQRKRTKKGPPHHPDTDTVPQIDIQEMVPPEFPEILPAHRIQDISAISLQPELSTLQDIQTEVQTSTLPEVSYQLFAEGMSKLLAEAEQQIETDREKQPSDLQTTEQEALEKQEIQPPLEQIIELPVDQLTVQPIEQIIEQPVLAPAEQLIEQPIPVPVEQPIEQVETETEEHRCRIEPQIPEASVPTIVQEQIKRRRISAAPVAPLEPLEVEAPSPVKRLKIPMPLKDTAAKLSSNTIKEMMEFFGKTMRAVDVTQDKISLQDEVSARKIFLKEPGRPVSKRENRLLFRRCAVMSRDGELDYRYMLKPWQDESMEEHQLGMSTLSTHSPGTPSPSLRGILDSRIPSDGNRIHSDGNRIHSDGKSLPPVEEERAKDPETAKRSSPVEQEIPEPPGPEMQELQIPVQEPVFGVTTDELPVVAITVAPMILDDQPVQPPPQEKVAEEELERQDMSKQQSTPERRPPWIVGKKILWKRLKTLWDDNHVTVFQILCPPDQCTKFMAASTFGLILELQRRGRVRLEQDSVTPFSTIYIHRRLKSAG